MSKMLIPLPGKDLNAWAHQLTHRLRQLLTAEGSLPIRDDQGRVIVSPQGIFVYDDLGQVVIEPANVQIDTQHLVDAAITLEKMGPDSVDEEQLRVGAITAQKAIIGEGAILTAMIAEAQIVNAHIADAEIDDAKINNLSAGKLLAGVISTNQIFVGGPEFELDGVNTRLRITDEQATPEVRVDLGRLGPGAEDYGIEIFRSDGALIVGANGLGTNIVTTDALQDGSVTEAKIGSLSADSITTGTLDASDVNVINLNANNITTGTFAADRIDTGTLSAGSIQIGSTPSGATVRLLNDSNLVGFQVQDTNGTNRLLMGQFKGSFTSGFGIHLQSATGTTVIDTRSGQAINGTFIQDLTVSNAKIIGLSANKITAGTIDANFIDVINLNASNITTGSLTADHISVNTIDIQGLNNAGALASLNQADKDQIANQAVTSNAANFSSGHSETTEGVWMGLGDVTITIREAGPVFFHVGMLAGVTGSSAVSAHAEYRILRNNVEVQSPERLLLKPEGTGSTDALIGTSYARHEGSAPATITYKIEIRYNRPDLSEVRANRVSQILMEVRR